MLDPQFIRDNKEEVKKGIAAKQYNPKIVDEFLALDKKRRCLLTEVEELRAKRNEISKGGKVSEEGKKIKEDLKNREPELAKIEVQVKEALSLIPNLPVPDAPVGKSEKENKILREWGKPSNLDFKVLDHVTLAEKLDLIDFKNGSKVSGTGFYYLKNDAVLLEFALVHYALDLLIKKGYTPFVTPDLARERYYLGTGYLPRGPEAQTYTIADSDLGLIATSEVTLAGLHADEILIDLPKRYCGYSHCFRLEAGGYGKYSAGLYRVHQFTKIEMFVYATPEDSSKMHSELLENEEEIWQGLEIPYRVVEMCTGDLGAQAAKKFDLEAWLPGRGEWGEVTSCSNTTDYQARNLNIKYRGESGKIRFAHTLNGTAAATSRALIAILENYKQKDGTVKVPKVLVPYVGKEVISH